VYFRHVKLKDASTLTTKGLKVLKQHKVIDLEVNGLRITVNDLISCLGEWSLENLRSLSIARGSFVDCSMLVQFLSKFYSLSFKYTFLLILCIILQVLCCSSLEPTT
jgi:Zyg-11 family protein